MVAAPSPTTLKKYGLSAEQWLAVLNAQGNVCAICGKVPTTGRWVTDHAHVKGFKKMPPEQKRKYVRGITCWWDNKNFLARGLTIEKAKSVVIYLEAFAARLAANDNSSTERKAI